MIFSRENITSEKTEKDYVRWIILLGILIFLLISHIRGQATFPLRGLFVALGILLVSVLALVVEWKNKWVRRYEFWALVSYFLFTLWAGWCTYTAPVPAEGYFYSGTFLEGVFVLCSIVVIAPRLKQHYWVFFAFFAILIALSIFKALSQYFWEFATQLKNFDEIAGMYPERIREGIEFALREKRVFSFYGNPNIFCGFLAMGFPTLLWFIKLKSEIPLLRILAILLALLVLLTAFLTGSRGGLLSLFIGAVVFFLAQRQNIRITKKSATLFLLTVVVICFASWGVLFIRAKTKSTTVRSELGRWTNISTLKERLYYQDVAIKMIKTSPVLGNGLGSYGLMYPQLKHPDAFESRFSHNFVTQIWAELGIIGLGLFGLFLGIVALGGKKSHPKTNAGTDDLRLTRGAIIGAISAFLFSSLVDYTFYYREFFLDFMLLTGVLITLSPASEKEILSARTKYKKIIIAGMLGICFLLSTKVIFWHQLAEYYYQKGLDYLREQNVGEGLKYLRKSVRYEPESPMKKADYGKTLFLAGDTLRGLSILEEAARLNPYSAFIRSEIANCMLEMGFPGQALKYAERAVQLYPTKAKYHYQLARIYHLTNQPEKAHKEINLAIRFAKDKEEAVKYKEFLDALSISGKKTKDY